MDTIIALKVLINGFLILAFWHVLWKDCAQERFRLDLFAIRDDLFSLASEGKYGINFNSQAYGMQRTSINRMIRLAPSITFVGIVFFQFVSKLRKYPEGSSNTERVLALCPNEETRKEFLRLQKKMGISSVVYLMKISPFFLIKTSISMLMIAFALGHLHCQKFWNRYSLRKIILKEVKKAGSVAKIGNSDGMIARIISEDPGLRKKIAILEAQSEEFGSAEEARHFRLTPAMFLSN